MHKQFLAIVLLIYGVFGTGWLDLLDKPMPQPEPAPPPAKILNIDKPSEEIIEKVSPFSDLITDPTDRAKVAIFNYNFANRVLNYEAEAQQVNDVYVLAGKLFFKKTLVDKYKGLAEDIVDLMTDCMGDENHILTEEEKNLLHQHFLGVAWVLIQKG
jgi:hypothetical protein